MRVSQNYNISLQLLAMATAGTESQRRVAES